MISYEERRRQEHEAMEEEFQLMVLLIPEMSNEVLLRMSEDWNGWDENYCPFQSELDRRKGVKNA